MKLKKLQKGGIDYEILYSDNVNIIYSPTEQVSIGTFHIDLCVTWNITIYPLVAISNNFRRKMYNALTLNMRTPFCGAVSINKSSNIKCSVLCL